MIALFLRIVACFGCLVGLGLLTKHFDDSGTDIKQPDQPTLPMASVRSVPFPQASFPVLLSRSEVRQELGLDNIQPAQVDERLSDMLRQLEHDRPYVFPDDFIGVSEEECSSRFATNYDFVHLTLQTAEDDLVEILHSDQLDRLRQLRLQRLGMLAFQQREVLSHLQLTRIQRARIGDLAICGPGVETETQARCRAQLEVILSDVQLESWRALVGKSFRFPDPKLGKNSVEQRSLDLLIGFEPQSPRSASPALGHQIF